MKDATETTKSVFLPSSRPKSTSGCSRGGKTNEESSLRSKLGTAQAWLSHTSLRQLQVLHSTKHVCTHKNGDISYWMYYHLGKNGG